MSGNAGSSLDQMIREDLIKMENRREIVKAGFLEKKMTRKVSPKLLHVNPNDEFSSPQIGPNPSIVENYCQIARRNEALGLDVFEEEILVCKLRKGGYLIQNGHHRWAGAIKACVPTVRISILNPSGE